jgi:epoxyqueuosine reductase QueG
MDISRDKLNEWVQSLDLDMVGVASLDGYRDVEPQWNPLSILPKAKSIVVFGKSIPRSYFRGIEDGTLWNRVNRQLTPKPAYYLCRMFEDNTFLAVPCTPLAPERWPDGVVFKAGKPAPNVTPDIYYAAQLAGLGEIAYNGTFLTPRFGARQALGMLFTEADIEPDEPFKTGQLCTREKCFACVKGCPARALSATPTTRKVGDQTIKVGKFENEKCRFCVNGAFPDTSLASAPPNRLAAACTRACIACLEDSGKVKTNYKSKVRRREAWGFDTFAA